jgi:hypothetical protein
MDDRKPRSTRRLFEAKDVIALASEMKSHPSGPHDPRRRRYSEKLRAHQRAQRLRLMLLVALLGVGILAISVFLAQTSSESQLMKQSPNR